MMQGEDGFRPRCLEVQLLNGKAGDFWILGKLPLKVNGVAAGGYSRARKPSSEKQPGAWNELKARVIDGKVEVDINGVRQHEAHDAPRFPGRIGLQVEGHAIEFRRIQLERIR